MSLIKVNSSRLGATESAKTPERYPLIYSSARGDLDYYLRESSRGGLDEISAMLHALRGKVEHEGR